MINKREAIIFLIEQCYKNFPELIEEIPKEEMYKTLMKNISNIRGDGKHENIKGLYSSRTKEIQILNKGKINLKDIKEDQDIINTLAHEGVHGMFRKTSRSTRN
ncbi:MAG: hypothetical protein E7313_04955 [Clostridiales bacterium]|nr:hypothetical protein [Clostridiales bacterium]